MRPSGKTFTPYHTGLSHVLIISELVRQRVPEDLAAVVHDSAKGCQRRCSLSSQRQVRSDGLENRTRDHLFSPPRKFWLIPGTPEEEEASPVWSLQAVPSTPTRSPMESVMSKITSLKILKLNVLLSLRIGASTRTSCGSSSRKKIDILHYSWLCGNTNGNIMHSSKTSSVNNDNRIKRRHC